MAACQKADYRHLDDMGFPLDDQRNIVLDGSNGLSCTHMGLEILVVQEWTVIWHDGSLTKGTEVVNFHMSLCILQSREDDS